MHIGRIKMGMLTANIDVEQPYNAQRGSVKAVLDGGRMSVRWRFETRKMNCQQIPAPAAEVTRVTNGTCVI